MAKPRSLLRMFIITEDRRPALFWRVVGYAVVFGVCLGLRNPLQSVLQHSADSLLLGALGVVLTESVVVALAIAATTCITYVFRCKVGPATLGWHGFASPLAKIGRHRRWLRARYRHDFGCRWARIRPRLVSNRRG